LRPERLWPVSNGATLPSGLMGGSAGVLGVLLLVGLVWTRRRQV